MRLTTAKKIKVFIAKDLNKNLSLCFPCLLNKQGKKLSNPMNWVAKVNNNKRGLYE